MDSFEVIISPKALSQLNNYIDYLQYTLLNDQAAYNVWQDALETREHLSKVASSLKFCAHPELRKQEYRIVHFMRHRYLMLYRIAGKAARISFSISSPARHWPARYHFCSIEKT